jgi:hypothetical protein
MKNRYGDKYSFEPIGDNIYKFVMTGDSMNWCRYGGQENQDGIDYNNLGFFDPSGGPFISVGNELEIGIVKHIKSTADGIIIKVE